jgi:hypothetical protein
VNPEPGWTPLKADSPFHPMFMCAACQELGSVDEQTRYCRPCWRLWFFTRQVQWACKDCQMPIGLRHAWNCQTAKIHGSPRRLREGGDAG